MDTCNFSAVATDVHIVRANRIPFEMGRNLPNFQKFTRFPLNNVNLFLRFPNAFISVSTLYKTSPLTVKLPLFYFSFSIHRISKLYHHIVATFMFTSAQNSWSVSSDACIPSESVIHTDRSTTLPQIHNSSLRQSIKQASTAHFSHLSLWPHSKSVHGSDLHFNFPKLYHKVRVDISSESWLSRAILTLIYINLLFGFVNYITESNNPPILHIAFTSMYFRSDNIAEDILNFCSGFRGFALCFWWTSDVHFAPTLPPYRLYSTEFSIEIMKCI